MAIPVRREALDPRCEIVQRAKSFKVVQGRKIDRFEVRYAIGIG